LSEQYPWPKITPGAHVGTICTAKAISMEEIQPALAWMQTEGYVMHSGKTIGQRHHQLGGTDAERAADLISMLQDEAISAIWFARGGYGTIRIMDLVEPFLTGPALPLMCGYSDLTVLHAYLNTQKKIPTLHSCMPVQFQALTSAARQSFLDCLKHEPPLYEMKPSEYNIHGEVVAPITGGNISILNSLLGTKYDWLADGWILFLEEVDEWLYHLDRMMQSFKLAGKLDKLKGVIVGGLTNMHDNEIPFGASAEGIIANYFKHLSLPVAFGFPAGHLDNNCSIPFGVPAKLTVNANGSSVNFSPLANSPGKVEE
jgi:muramoyltetrapeptide carboxypeptidase